MKIILAMFCHTAKKIPPPKQNMLILRYNNRTSDSFQFHIITLMNRKQSVVYRFRNILPLIYHELLFNGILQLI